MNSLSTRIKEFSTILSSAGMQDLLQQANNLHKEFQDIINRIKEMNKKQDEISKMSPDDIAKYLKTSPARVASFLDKLKEIGELFSQYGSDKEQKIQMDDYLRKHPEVQRDLEKMYEIVKTAKMILC